MKARELIGNLMLTADMEADVLIVLKGVGDEETTAEIASIEFDGETVTITPQE